MNHESNRVGGLDCDRLTPSSSHGIESGSPDGREKPGGVLERNGVAPWLGATHASPYGAAPSECSARPVVAGLCCRVGLVGMPGAVGLVGMLK
jgi:hypothetical protein